MSGKRPDGSGNHLASYPVVLPLTAFAGSYETSLIGNMRVASQRITLHQVVVTPVINLHISHKSHSIFL